MKNDTLLVIPCPPLKTNLTPPLDQIDCMLTDCPVCDEKMWLSKNKILLIESKNGKDMFIACHDCIMDFLKNNTLENSKKILIEIHRDNDKKKYRTKLG